MVSHAVDISGDRDYTVSVDRDGDVVFSWLDDGRVWSMWVDAEELRDALRELGALDYRRPRADQPEAASDRVRAS